jgi:hypothetical protein
VSSLAHGKTPTTLIIINMKPEISLGPILGRPNSVGTFLLTLVGMLATSSTPKPEKQPSLRTTQLFQLLELLKDHSAGTSTKTFGSKYQVT